MARDMSFEAVVDAQAVGMMSYLIGFLPGPSRRRS
jgi:hypothetical protein